VAHSLKKTYVDGVLFKEIRSLFNFTMDAVVFSNRSKRGRKYGYIFICMGPSGYQEGFTLVNQSDLCEVFSRWLSVCVSDLLDASRTRY
jgi:hypothetical protein